MSFVFQSQQNAACVASFARMLKRRDIIVHRQTTILGDLDVRMPVFRRTKPWLMLGTGLLLSSIILAACGGGTPPSILNTDGQVAANETFLFWVILYISIIVFVAVEGALIFSIVRYRERPGTPNPRQNHGNLTLEILWTAIPTLALFVVLFFTIRGLVQVAPDAQPAGKTVNVTAIGHQWWWEFYYPDYNITTADVMHVPTGTTIHLNLFSNNVIHSFWVPSLTGKTDVVPGHNNIKWFVADNPGTFTGICAEYCGNQHANMRFQVDADNNDTFNSWVTAQLQSAATPASSTDKYSAAAGLIAFKGACTGCHGIEGVNVTKYLDTSKVCDDSQPQHENNAYCGLIGPNLTHFGSRELIAGGVLTNNVSACDPNDPNLYNNCNLAKWLKDPQAIKPGNDMVISLNDTQIRNLVAYLESLK